MMLSNRRSSFARETTRLLKLIWLAPTLNPKLTMNHYHSLLLHATTVTSPDQALDPVDTSV